MPPAGRARPSALLACAALAAGALALAAAAGELLRRRAATPRHTPPPGPPGGNHAAPRGASSPPEAPEELAARWLLGAAGTSARAAAGEAEAYPGARLQPYVRHCKADDDASGALTGMDEVARRAVALRATHKRRAAVEAGASCSKMLFFHAPKAGGTSVERIIAAAAARGAVRSYSPWEWEV